MWRKGIQKRFITRLCILLPRHTRELKGAPFLSWLSERHTQTHVHRINSSITWTYMHTYMFFIFYLRRLNLVDSLHLLVLVPISKFRNHWAFSNRPIYSKAFYFTPSPFFPTRIHKLHPLPLKKIKPNINTLWICRLTRIEPGATQTTDSSVAMQPHEPTNQYWSAVHTSKIWPAIATSVFLYILGVVHRVSPSWRSVHERAWLICCSCCPAAALSGFCGCFFLSLWRAVCSVGIASRDVGSRVGLDCVSCFAVGGTSWFGGVCFVYYVGFVCCYVAFNNLGTSNPSSDHVEAFM